MKITIFLFLVILPSVLMADGPIFQHKDTFDQQEFENVYQDVRSLRNGQILFGFGSVTSPSIPVGVSNTGIWSSSSGRLDFTTSGTNRLSIGSSSIDFSLKAAPNSDNSVGLGDESHRWSDYHVVQGTVTNNLNIGSQTGLQFGGYQSFPIVQIKEGLLTSATSFTTTSYANTGLSVTIAPRFSSSKIMIIVQANVRASNAAAGACVANAKIVRGATDVRRIVEFMGANVASSFAVGTYSMVAYDAPATTNSTTYNVQLANNTGNGTVLMNDDATGAGTSAIYAIEIAQ